MTQNGIVLVASVSVIKDAKILMIKENKQNVVNKWNFPSGRIEGGEDIIAAACREVKEETGLEVRLVKTTGVYNFISSYDDQVILFHFIGEVIGGTLKLEESEIIDSRWFTRSELANFKNEELREPHVLRQIYEAILKERFYPTNIFQKQAK